MHTSLQGVQEKKINVLKKELTKIDWYTGMDFEFELEWQKKLSQRICTVALK